MANNSEEGQGAQRGHASDDDDDDDDDDNSMDFNTTQKATRFVPTRSFPSIL
jgi:hypothetical protein